MVGNLGPSWFHVQLKIDQVTEEDFGGWNPEGYH